MMMARLDSEPTRSRVLVVVGGIAAAGSVSAHVWAPSMPLGSMSAMVGVFLGMVLQLSGASTTGRGSAWWPIHSFFAAATSTQRIPVLPS
jgi:hypothetical protein